MPMPCEERRAQEALTGAPLIAQETLEVRLARMEEKHRHIEQWLHKISGQLEVLEVLRPLAERHSELAGEVATQARAVQRLQGMVQNMRWFVLGMSVAGLAMGGAALVPPALLLKLTGA
ncbi:MAG: hypothetical protein CMM94_07675 [Rickettsiales bacterium]|nr:hypothetical protein [Rickettsiales bacterium]